MIYRNGQMGTHTVDLGTVFVDIHSIGSPKKNSG